MLAAAAKLAGGDVPVDVLAPAEAAAVGGGARVRGRAPAVRDRVSWLVPGRPAELAV